jgi:hypothetical protein
MTPIYAVAAIVVAEAPKANIVGLAQTPIPAISWIDSLASLPGGKVQKGARDRGPAMTTRDALHQLVDQLPDAQAELARAWLQDLRGAADEDGPPLKPEALASLDRGLADLAAGRVKPLADYERERGL